MNANTSFKSKCKMRDSQPENPYEKANIFSRALFLWLNPFIRKGFRKRLTLDDLYRTPEEDLSKDLGQQLQFQWNRELKYVQQGKRASLIRAIYRAFGFWYLLAGIWVTIGECIFRPLQAIALAWLINDSNSYASMDPVLTDPNVLDAAYWKVFLDGIYLILFSVVCLITVHPHVYCCQHTGMKVRIACCHVIYRHALKLSNSAIGQTTVGQMVNLLTNDVNRFDVALIYMQYLLVAPIQAIIMATILSTMYLGLYPTLAGSALLLLFVPFQSLMGRWFGRLRELTALRTDERIRLMNEIVSAMRVIKMYTWEDPFANLVELARRNEVRLIRYTSFLRAINMAMFFVASKLILFTSLITYILLGYTLNPQIVFVSITVFNAVRLLMTLFFPYGVANFAETLISCSRLQEFLLLPEQEYSPRVFRGQSDGQQVPKQQVKLISQDVCANWTIVSRANPFFDRDESLGSGSKSAQQISHLKQMSPSSKESLADLAKLRLSTDPSSSSKDGMVISALRNISYEMKPGELMIIVGRVGSGKSSVLMSILGELPLTSGQLTTEGLISYAAQESWIFAGTVRENVLFGKRFDQERYNQVLRVCSLDKDIKLFPHGDETVVGERGVSLSGGQRARINLARAIYYEADIYLLDDPLSAVDTVVAKHIFNECICDFLKDKVVVLATHQTQFVKRDTKVLFLQDGRQISCKSYSDNTELQLFIGSNWEKSDSESAPSGTGPKSKQSMRVRTLGMGASAMDSDGSMRITQKLAETHDPRISGGPSRSSSSGNSDQGSHKEEDDDDDGEISGEAPIKQNWNPDSVDGDNQANYSIYWYYIRASSSLILVITLFITNMGTQVLFNGCDFWLSLWTDTEQRKAANNGTNVEPAITVTDSLTLDQNATIYTILVASLFVLTLIRTTCFFITCMRSSIVLHNRLFRSVLKAPIKFFDSNPIGILLNRVSRDMGIVDDLFPPTAFDTIEIFINVIGTLVTVAIIYPINVLPAIILCAVVFIIRPLYLRTVRSIKSIEGSTRSPVFSHLAASLNGLTTIRAFRVEPQFEVKFDEYQDIHTSAWFLFVCSSRWLGITMDCISLGYIAVITIVATLTTGSITSSQLGLAISSALSLSGSFQWGVRQSTEMESQMTSVARIKEYSELPEEPPRESPPDRRPPADWPQAGEIDFKQVSLRYSEDEDPVLKKLTFKIKPGEKVGIVGRTGAGKSSIIAVLFRLTEPEGSIHIDGIETKSIGLHELRKKLSIIPQEPVLFNGTIRRNLDPFGDFDDQKIWKALEQVKLSELVRSLPGNLESELNEGGSNFSVGERQLICLARAVLRQNKIIILDEATANVDPNTDKFIQRTISESFTNCTRLTIAHRLNTIMDSDRVLVMDAGQVKEFNAPHLLLQNENGLFSTMVNNTGKNAAHLRRLAKNYYERKISRPAKQNQEEVEQQQQQPQEQPKVEEKSQ